jgi:hypothetical protein
MDKLEIKRGSFIQQTQYFIPDSPAETNVWLRNIKMKVELYLLYRIPGK